VDDEGVVTISSPDKECSDAAMKMVKEIVQEAEVGKLYQGKVVKIMDFGAFVEIFPGTDGLVHISQLAPERVNKVTDVLNEGDEVLVKVLEVGKDGRIRLSRKAASGRRPWMNRKTVLNNGVRIVSERLPHVRSVSLGIWVNTGSRDESPLENGVSHFIEHMSFKGTRTRSGFQIAKDLDAIGGLSNAFTGKETTCFYGRVLDRHFPLLADILSDIFVYPTFPAEDMEREREVIFQEISMVEDTPDDYLNVLFQDLFWPDHPIGRSVLGSTETVGRMDQKMIREYIRKYYVPQRVLVVAAGNVDHDEMVEYFRPIFEADRDFSSENPERSLPIHQRRRAGNAQTLEQVHFCLGSDAPSQVDESRFACALLNTVLGGNMSSRLFQEIRENRGLAYSVYSFFSPYADAGLFGVYAATDAKNMNAVLEITQNEIRKLCRGELDAVILRLPRKM
jgi:predicted Zn-dependent peptidase